MLDFLKINELDNVEVALRGTETIPAGHKKAIKPIKKGEKVIKYGNPIGVATADIAEGEWSVYVNDRNAGTTVLDTVVDGKVIVNAISALVLAK